MEEAQVSSKKSKRKDAAYDFPPSDTVTLSGDGIKPEFHGTHGIEPCKCRGPCNKDCKFTCLCKKFCVKKKHKDGRIMDEQTRKKLISKHLKCVKSIYVALQTSKKSKVNDFVNYYKISFSFCFKLTLFSSECWHHCFFEKWTELYHGEFTTTRIGRRG